MGVALPSGATHSAAVANHAHGAERAFARQTAPCPVRCLSYKASIPHNPKRGIPRCVWSILGATRL